MGKNENNKLKILVVTYDYYPDPSPNTYRWHHILKEWSKDGHQIFVVSAQKPGFSKAEKIDGINVYRTGQSWLEILKAKLPKTIKVDDLNAAESQRSLTKESVVKRFYNLTFKKVYFPDFAFLWYYPAKKLAKRLMEQHDIKNLITVSWPFTDHKVGYDLKNKFNINWIADTIDPFYLSDAVNNTNLYKKANWRLENKILSKASYITVLTSKLKQKYIELYPSLEHKLVVNHNMFIPYTIENTDVKKRSEIKMAFFGTLTPKTRSPKILLQLMDTIEKLEKNQTIQLHIYGDTSQCDNEFENFKHLIGKNIYVHGLISKEDVRKCSQDADILVNIGNTNEYQEPSKIVEYVYINKPILNICSITNDSSKELLDRYPLSFNFYKDDLNDNSKIATVLNFIADVYKRPLAQNNIDLISNYLSSEVQKRYFKLLKHP